MSNSTLIILLLSLFLTIKSAHSGPRATEAARICTNATAPQPQRQTFLSNFLAALDAVTPLVSGQRYAAVVRGTAGSAATVYAFGECMKDLSQRDCDVCFAESKIRVLSCLAFQFATLGGRIFYDGCYIRYENFDFFNQSLSREDREVCGDRGFGGNASVFKDNVQRLVRSLSDLAPKNDGFAVGFSGLRNETVYGLAQCWELVNGSACEECLANAVGRIGSCPPKEEGRVLNAGCYLRYSTQKFYGNSTRTEDVGNGGRPRVAKILAATFAALAVVLTILAVAFLTRKKLLKKRKDRKQFGALLATLNKSQLNFSYEVLERATNYFHDSNKLGQGGSGSVYKGTLPDEKVVAVKRLFFNSRQWVDHFFNEVNLISGIHHKNLVKLLGCSLTGPESLLVYEYVPNQSILDYFVANNNVEPLRWELRYKIILGTAEGLAYLHEESKLKIIHRDIKLSNILLDEEFMPKIADFGLARLLPEDKTHISTAIAGTLGYMAPEYIVRGKLTEKADVYSFGVLVIEVVCGKRNNIFVSNSASILQMTWDLYGKGRLCNAVDPLLKGLFEEEEASRLLQIGLLCVQASAELRPAMSLVVKLLTENLEIPRPTQPPFLHSGSSEFTRHIHSEALDTPLVSNNPQSSRNRMTQSWLEPR